MRGGLGDGALLQARGGGLEEQLDGAELLKRLVVQLTRPALALLVRRSHRGAQAVGGDTLSGCDRDRGARGEGDQEMLIVATEAALVAHLGKGHEHAAGLAPVSERHEQGRTGSGIEQVEAVARP